MRKLTILAAVVAMAAIVSGAVVSAGPAWTIKTTGGVQFVPNALIMSNLAFSPGPIKVDSGDVVTWVHADQTEDPHTVTIVNLADLPAAIEEVFVCEAIGPCGAALAAHFGPPPTFILDPDADGGLSVPGDSLLFFHGQTISSTITAPSGTTLYYLCAIHPWMQGSIEVR